MPGCAESVQLFGKYSLENLVSITVYSDVVENIPQCQISRQTRRGRN